MDGEKNPEIVPIQGGGYVPRHEFNQLLYEFRELKEDLKNYERRWIDQNKRIHKLREAYHALRRWQNWILGAATVGSYAAGVLSDWFKSK